MIDEIITSLCQTQDFNWNDKEDEYAATVHFLKKHKAKDLPEKWSGKKVVETVGYSIYL